MPKALEQAIERLKLMSEDRQDSFSQLLMHEIDEDERWRKSTAKHADKSQCFLTAQPENIGSEKPSPEEPEPIDFAGGNKGSGGREGY